MSINQFNVISGLNAQYQENQIQKNSQYDNSTNLNSMNFLDVSTLLQKKSESDKNSSQN